MYLGTFPYVPLLARANSELNEAVQIVNQTLEKPHHLQDFWRHAFAMRGSIVFHVLPNVLAVGAVSTIICFATRILEQQFHLHLRIEVAPYELIGAALAVLLVLRTSVGYDRWWEVRKLSFRI